MENMASGVFRLKGRQLFSKGFSERRVRNVQELADRSGMTYSTAHRWVNASEEITGADFKNLAGFLIDGLQMTPEEIAKMPFGEIFEYLPLYDKQAT